MPIYIIQECVTACKDKPTCKLVIGQQKPLGNPQSTRSQFSAVCTSIGNPCRNCPKRLEKAAVCTGKLLVKNNQNNLTPGKLPFDCQKIAKNLTFFQKKLPKT